MQNVLDFMIDNKTFNGEASFFIELFMYYKRLYKQGFWWKDDSGIDSCHFPVFSKEILN